jgi:hypothetical protein
VDQIISLSTGLARLTEYLDRPEADLEGELRRLSDELARAVDSYLLPRIEYHDHRRCRAGQPERVARPGRMAVGSSLLIPLPLICAAPPGSALMLHAAQPGAFVDLAADLSFALGEPLPTFVLDDHLGEHLDRSSRPELLGLAESSQINQAIGVLLACGHTREQALAELWLQASDICGDVHSAAEAITNRAELGLAPTRTDPTQQA